MTFQKLFILATFIGTGAIGNVGSRCYGQNLNGKTVTEQDKDTTIWFMATEMPKYTGGDEAMYKFLQKNIHYPASQTKEIPTSKVYIDFVIEKDGRITNVRKRKNNAGKDEMAEEAIRVIKSMPIWIPGKQNSMPIRVQLSLPMNVCFK